MKGRKIKFFNADDVVPYNAIYLDTISVDAPFDSYRYKFVFLVEEKDE